MVCFHALLPTKVDIFTKGWELLYNVLNWSNVGER